MSEEGEITTSTPLLINEIAQSEVITFSNHNPPYLAWRDISEGFSKWRIWLMLAYQDIKLRYRRSILGPFWITLSMAITVYAMGILYARLFRAEIADYYPFLVAGMLGWSFIASSMNDLVEAFMSYESLIKQIKLPYSLYIHRIITRNLIIFCHNFLVMIPIFFLFPQGAKINLNFFFIIPGVALLYGLAFSYGLILAMIGAKYRDVTQIIKSIIQVIFFVTPIMWNPVVLSEKSRHLVYLNPFYSFLELMRAPLLGKLPTSLNIEISLLCLVIGILIAAKIFIPYRSRIIYWL